MLMMPMLIRMLMLINDADANEDVDVNDTDVNKDGYVNDEADV